ncbi:MULTISPECIES: sugar ABC transporter ATP-binding protein [unclassified Actinomyces]|uniref:sugar ABC transporter ATP-binding protein n=1 Tax=unclassified Actinomyces TaxID=2609248 RepID=UPI000D590874|nr:MULTISPECIES: sugar ABC transporter ATP-binding protein [unclassified Actinomyces]RAX20466.1 sugar ABC transporter ATP-binding protein [Actinomyces sp. Z3]
MADAVRRAGGKRPDVEPRLKIRGIRKSFGDTRALRDISFELLPGEIHALVGENGAGKSTLIKILTGFQKQDRGEIVLDGEPVSFASTLDARAAGVAAVYQDPALFPSLTVAENIFAPRYPMRAGRVDKVAMKKAAQELLDDLGFDIRADAVVSDLSVAQCEYVEIARALSSDLRLLILDEPTSSLTPKEASDLYGVVRRLRETRGTTIVWISHRLEEVHTLADRVTIMRDGSHVRTCYVDDITTDEIIALMVGRELDLEPHHEETTLGAPVLEVRNLSATNLFEDVGFTVHSGEILGVAGLVGAGRSEVGQAVFGLVPGFRGEVLLNGVRVPRISTRRMVRSGVVYLPEDRDYEGVVTDMSVSDNLVLPSLRTISTHGLRNKRAERSFVAKQIKELEIKARPDDIVASLSGGNKQKVALGRWLSIEPGLLILDEPTHGIDVGTKAEVHAMIRRLAREERRAVIVISSDMPELLALSDRIVVMCRGHVTAELDASTATQEQIMAAAVRSAHSQSTDSASGQEE